MISEFLPTEHKLALTSMESKIHSIRAKTRNLKCDCVE